VQNFRFSAVELCEGRGGALRHNVASTSRGGFTWGREMGAITFLPPRKVGEILNGRLLLM